MEIYPCTTVGNIPVYQIGRYIRVPDWEIYQTGRYTRVPDWEIYQCTRLGDIPDWEIYPRTRLGYIPDWEIYTILDIYIRLGDIPVHQIGRYTRVLD